MSTAFIPFLNKNARKLEMTFTVQMANGEAIKIFHVIKHYTISLNNN